MDFLEFYEITDQLKTRFDILQIGLYLITSQIQKYLIFLGEKYLGDTFKNY